MRSLFIFRQDLRIHDNHWLRQTVQSSQEVFPVFIFDTNILAKFPEQDPRLWFLAEALIQLDQDLRKIWSYLTVCYGDSIEIIQSLAVSLKVDTIARNRSYGYSSLTRDKAIQQRAETQWISTKSYSDYLLVEPEEVIPMKVFTPFKNRWLKELSTKDYSKPYTIKNITTPTWNQIQSSFALYTWDDLIPAEITKKSIWYDNTIRPIDLWSERITKDYTDYDETRNIPSIDGTTKLSPYTRFWLVSIREIYRHIVIARNEAIHKNKYFDWNIYHRLPRRSSSQ